MEDESTKDTKGEANGLPAGWVWTTIGQATQPIEKVDPRENPDQQFTYLDISSIDNTLNRVVEPKTYQGADAPSRARQRVRSDDVLFSTVRTYLKNVALVPETHDGQIASTGFSVLRAVLGIDARFLYYYILTEQFLSPLNDLQRGTSYPAVRDRDVREQPFPVAPPTEQRRIVAKIEELLTRLDAGVSGLKRVQAALKRYRAAVLKAACEGRLAPQDPNDEPAAKLLGRILAERRAKWEANLRAKGKDPAKAKYEEPAGPETEGLAALPDGWCWATVEQLARVGTGATPLRSKDAYYKEGTIPWVTSSALNELYVNSADEFITNLAVKETNAKMFPAGTLLVAMYGEGKTRGKVSELNIDATTNQAVAAMVLDGVASKCRGYIKAFFLKNYEDIRRLSSGGVQPNLNLAIVKHTRLPLPPLAEQKRILNEVERRLSVVQVLEKAVKANLVRAERLRQAVLRQAFEGKLVAQDTTDELANAPKPTQRRTG